MLTQEQIDGLNAGDMVRNTKTKEERSFIYTFTFPHTEGNPTHLKVDSDFDEIAIYWPVENCELVEG